LLQAPNPPQLLPLRIMPTGPLPVTISEP
jgi:hypothetical protein